MLLAIDTSAGTSVAALWASGCHEEATNNTMTHAEVVGTFIDSVIERSGKNLTDITGVVAGIGPGPFTGLRVGLAAASAFAVGRGVPLLPVVSHDAIAFDALEEIDGAVLVVTDARRKELYWSIYDGFDEHGLPHCVGGPALAKPEDLPAEWDGRPLTRWEATELSAGLLAMIASRKLAAGLDFEPFEPLYLRSPDVTMSNGPKRVVQ